MFVPKVPNVSPLMAMLNGQNSGIQNAIGALDHYGKYDRGNELLSKLAGMNNATSKDLVKARGGEEISASAQDTYNKLMGIATINEDRKYKTGERLAKQTFQQGMQNDRQDFQGKQNKLSRAIQNANLVETKRYHNQQNILAQSKFEQKTNELAQRAKTKQQQEEVKLRQWVGVHYSGLSPQKQEEIVHNPALINAYRKIKVAKDLKVGDTDPLTGVKATTTGRYSTEIYQRQGKNVR